VESAIVGLPYVGKTTLFNLLTGGHAATGGFAGAEGAVNVGVAKVPDDRVDRLAALFKPKKTTHAEVRYADVGLARSAHGTPQGSGKADGAGAQRLGELRNADALVHVVRAFRDPSVPHVEGDVDPARDAAALELELLVADLAVVERRVERIAPELRSARATERDAKEREAALLERVRVALGAGTPVRDLGLAAEDVKVLRGYRLLSEKPELVVVNLDEADLARAEEIVAQVRASLATRAGTAVTAVCAKIEAEVAELPPTDASAFRAELGLSEPPLDRIARETYSLLGLVSFFTVGPDEVRAWTIPAGTTAQSAAGVIHTDLARGFIRAEVIRWDELLALGGLAEAKAKGKLRVESKEHVMLDGEVMNVLFNV
jgi:GTP-binding protein YchF